MDNFKGQTTPAVNEVLEEKNIHVCLLPPNSTDRLQPMDLTINKPIKDFMKTKFQGWYAEEISKQIDRQQSMEAVELEPVDLSLPQLKELGTRWLVEAYDYISENPAMVVRGFLTSGISDALNGQFDSDNDSSAEDESDGDEVNEDD